MTKATFFVGHNDGKTGAPMASENVRATIIEALKSQGIDGATLYTAAGIWNGEREETTVAICYGITEDQARESAEIMREILNQQAILFEIQEARAIFVEGGVL